MKKISPIIIILISLLALSQLVACANGKKHTTKNQNNMIVCYFSATGTTAREAKRIAEISGAELYEIIPDSPYTQADLDWTDSLSRSSVEMKDPAARPEIKKPLPDLSKYQTIFIGYPNWWNTCPRIINTFIEQSDLRGKKVVPFMTSGGSNITNSEKELRQAYPDISWSKGLLMNNVSDPDIKEWINVK